MSATSGGKRSALPDLDTASAFGARKAGLKARLAWWAATLKPLSSRWRKAIRKRFALGEPGPFDVTADGIRMRVYPAENHSDRTILGRGTLPEEAEHALIAPLLKPGMTFVDVGANVGVYTLFVAARTAGRARILALEPHPRTYAKLNANIAFNGFDGIVVLNEGAGPAVEQAELHSDGGGNIGNASLLPEVGGTKIATPIRMRPLTQQVAECGFDRIDLVKADIEGYEDRALMPFVDAADPALWPRHLLIEIVHAHLWERDIRAFLTENGYRLAGQTDENELYSR